MNMGSRSTRILPARIAISSLSCGLLVNGPTRKIPAIAETIKKLEARSDAIRRRLQVPCPTKYGNKEVAKDWLRLMEFTRLRDNETALTETQKAEEAHLKVRFDVFVHSPEQILRGRRKALEDAERLFKSQQCLEIAAQSPSRAKSEATLRCCDGFTRN